jgi:hypothetical protein
MNPPSFVEGFKEVSVDSGHWRKHAAHTRCACAGRAHGDANGQSFQIYLMAEVDDDTLKGTFSMAEMQGDWSGKRKK